MTAYIIRILRQWEPEPAVGGVNASTQRFIDDGVDYSQPLPLPQNLLGDDLLRAEAETLKASNPQAANALLQEAEAITANRAKFVQKFVEADRIYHNQFDKPYLYSENLSQFPTSDPLREWDWQGGFGLGSGGNRKDILSRCHLAYERNPVANTAVQLTTRFAIGEGLTITYKNEEVEEVLEAFRNNPDNAVDEYEKAFLTDLQVDGEVFIRFAKDDEGQTLIYPLKAWEIWWIQRDPFIQRRLVSYHWVAGLSNGVPGDYTLHIEDIPAEDVHYAAINRHSYDVRGKPELFRILPWLKAHKDWLEGRARQNHWRGALLWDVSLENATGVQVAAKRAQYRQPPPPGSLTIHNEKEVWKPLESHIGAADVAEDGRQIKMMAAVGAEIPEYMLSDGQNANLASATAQQLPALRKFTDFQDITVNQIWKPIYRKVLQNAIEAGILPEEVEEQDSDGETIYEDPEPNDDVTAGEDEMEAGVTAPSPFVPVAKMDQPLGPLGDGLQMPGLPVPPQPKGKPRMIKTLDAFDLKAPELESTDPKNLADALTIAKNNGWASDETASQKAGYDYRIEQKKIKREKAEAVRQGYQGGPMMPGQPTPPPAPFATNDPTQSGDNNGQNGSNPPAGTNSDTNAGVQN